MPAIRSVPGLGRCGRRDMTRLGLRRRRAPGRHALAEHGI
jgi:hypothetical protein